MRYQVFAVISDEHKRSYFTRANCPKVEDGWWLLDIDKASFPTLNEAYMYKMKIWDRHIQSGAFYYIVKEVE